MKKYAFLFTTLFVACTALEAQIKVNSSNNVGIGVDNPVSKLAVGNSGSVETKVYIENNVNALGPKALYVKQPAPQYSTGYDYAFGTYSTIDVTTAGYKHVGLMAVSKSNTSLTGARTYGVYAIAGNAMSGLNYSVYAALSGSNNGASVFAALPNRGDVVLDKMYAGYFRGTVYIEDSLRVANKITCLQLIQTSDVNLKKNITALPTGNLGKLSKLSAVKYQMLSTAVVEEVKRISKQDTLKTYLPTTNLDELTDKQTHIGLIAQEVQKVFPELVVKDPDGYLGIDYSGLIPVLIEAIKEQQAEIEALKEQIGKMSTSLK
ncbi:MAG: tail fiber domain-containing protein [Bacteroidales bacterium]